MTDVPVETHVVVDDEEGGERAIHFQEWWVRHQAAVPAQPLRRRRARPRDRRARGARRDPPGRRRAAAAEQPGRVDRHHPRRARGAGRVARHRCSRRRRLAAHLRTTGTRARRRVPRRRSASRPRAQAVGGLYEDFLDGWLVDPADAATTLRRATGRGVRRPAADARRRGDRPHRRARAAHRRRGARVTDARMPSPAPRAASPSCPSSGSARSRAGADLAGLLVDALAASGRRCVARRLPRRVEQGGLEGARPHVVRRRGRMPSRPAPCGWSPSGRGEAGVDPGRRVGRRAGDGRGRRGRARTPARAASCCCLPEDPDAEAARLRAAPARSGSDCPPRHRWPSSSATPPGGRGATGLTDFALGSAGLHVLEDLRGAHRPRRPPAGRDDARPGRRGGRRGRPREGEGGRHPGGPGARAATGRGSRPTRRAPASLVRTGRGDWFALGHVEAVRAALGVGAGSAAARRSWASGRCGPTSRSHVRVGRVVALALRDVPEGSADVGVRRGARAPPRWRSAAADDYDLGRLVTRLEVAAASEGLRAQAVDGAHLGDGDVSGAARAGRVLARQWRGRRGGSRVELAPNVLGDDPSTTANIAQRSGPGRARRRGRAAPYSATARRAPRRSSAVPDERVERHGPIMAPKRPNGRCRSGRTADADLRLVDDLSGRARAGGCAGPSAVRAAAGGARRARGGAARGSGARHTARAARRGRRHRPGCR